MIARRADVAASCRDHQDGQAACRVRYRSPLRPNLGQVPGWMQQVGDQPPHRRAEVASNWRNVGTWGVNRRRRRRWVFTSFLPSPTSPLWHPGHVHAFNDVPASSTKRRVLAKWNALQATDIRGRINRESYFHSSPRLNPATQDTRAQRRVGNALWDNLGWHSSFDVTTQLPRHRLRALISRDCEETNAVLRVCICASGSAARPTQIWRDQ